MSYSLSFEGNYYIISPIMVEIGNGATRMPPNGDSQKPECAVRVPGQVDSLENIYPEKEYLLASEDGKIEEGTSYTFLKKGSIEKEHRLTGEDTYFHFTFKCPSEKKEFITGFTNESLKKYKKVLIDKEIYEKSQSANHGPSIFFDGMGK